MTRAASPLVRMKQLAPSTACPGPAPSWVSLPESSPFRRYRDRSCRLRIISNGPDEFFASNPKSAAVQLSPHSSQQDLRGKWLRETFLLITILQPHLIRIPGD